MFDLIDNTLKALHPVVPYSLNATCIVWGTGAHESMGWTKRRQMGGGPALGYFQMEPITFMDIIKTYLAYRPKIEIRIKEVSGITELIPLDLVTNDQLAICMCRIKYLRMPGVLPGTLSGMASYWNQYYNANDLKGTDEEFIKNYLQYGKLDTRALEALNSLQSQ